MRRRLAAVLVLTSCGGAPGTFAVRFAEGERAETAGRHAEAAAAYDAAARAKAPPREQAHALFLAGLEHLRAGEVELGTQRLQAIVRTRGEHAAQARWELVSLDLATHPPHVDTELDDFIRTYPNDGLAYPALVARLRIARNAGGEAAAYEVLQNLEAAVARTDSAARIAYETAESLAKLGRLQEARDAFIAVAARWPYPRGEYFDDALYRASEVDESLGHYPEAIADLKRMLSVLEASVWPGSYVRPRFPDAGWRIAVLYRDRLADHAHAAQAFQEYVTMFPNALRRDEALWEAAKLASGEDACGTLARIAQVTPDSRYVPCVVAKCATVTRPKGSKAPERCHPYLER